MTVQELRDSLNGYPADMEVRVQDVIPGEDCPVADVRQYGAEYLVIIQGPWEWK